MDTTLSARDTASRLAGPIGDIGGRWLLSREVLGTAKDNGYPNGFVYYFLGRGGVLGDVDADVVNAAFGFFKPELVRTMWEQGLQVESPRAAAARYAAACAEFGRTHLSGFGGAQRFVQLAERVVDGSPIMGLALFAGWRAEARPDDAIGRAYFLTHVLREWRGSAHVVAVAASGLTPLQSILTGSGTDRAKLFGWGETFDDVSQYEAQRAECEGLTDQICSSVLDNLFTPEERAELVSLTDDLAAAFA
jgi:hypothetical protein